MKKFWKKTILFYCALFLFPFIALSENHSVDVTLTVGKRVEIKLCNYGFSLAQFRSSHPYSCSASNNELLLEENSTYNKVNGTNYSYNFYAVTPLKRGTYSLTYSSTNYYQSYSSRTDYVTFNIKAVEVSSISIPTTLSLTLGDTYTFSPVVIDNEAETTFTWSTSDASVVSVSNGTITALKEGVAIITCVSDNGVSAQSEVTVNPKKVTSIMLNYEECEIEKEQTLQLETTILPADAPNQNVIWDSSNSDIAMVSASGKVVALSEGWANITATTTDGSNLSAGCLVHVVSPKVQVTSLVLDIAEASLAPNETLTLSATLLPEDVTNPMLSWTSSNEDVATVDANGMVTAVADGEATITVSTTDGSNLSASCKVIVKTSVLAASLALDVTEASLAPNGILTLSATLLPESVTNPTLSWASSNENVVMVDANGVVIAVADGEATITVSTTDGSNLSASCKVAVKTSVLAASLALDVTEASLAPNETLTLSAILLPENVTNPTLTWISSNEEVATVDEYGVVTAVADGEATITVSTTDGSNLSATCVVIVETKEAGGDVTDYDNVIYFEDATAFVNTTVTLPLQMKNSAGITAVQFDVYLPDGVTIEKNSRGKYNITFNEDRADNSTHTLSSALQDDGAVRVLCYSTESYDFLDDEGAIFYFPLEIPEMEDGDYDVVIKNIVLTDVSGTKYGIPSMTSTITVLNVAPGDCNADNTIDVADIVVLANHILGTTATDFVEKAADYNADGAVDVADIVNIANYILNGNNAAARSLVREVMSTRAADTTYSLDILPFVLEAEGSKTIALDLTDPTESFTAFQCDLYLPEGISIETNNRGKYKFSFNEERTEAAYHTLSGSLQADGAVRMLCYSTDSEVFLGTEGALIYIPLTADASLKEGVYEFSIAGTVLTYQSGVKVTPETYKGSIVVGDGGEVEAVKLYGRYTSEVLDEYTAAFGTNSAITNIDLTEAIYLAEDGLLTTGNPNTIVYLAEGDALANESNVVSGDECANLVLTDGYAFSASVPFNASQASYERELAAGKYGTIVLPYAPNTDGYVFYALTSATDNMLTFDEVTNPVANTPYLYKLRDGESATQITNSEVAVSSELTSVGTPVWQMVGSFTNQTIVAGEDEENSYYVYTSSDNQVHQVTNTLTVKPYRAYFTTSSANNMQLAVRTRSGEETLIDASEVDGLCPEVYYDLSGRRVDNPTKGVYIVNGKKVVL